MTGNRDVYLASNKDPYPHEKKTGRVPWRRGRRLNEKGLKKERDKVTSRTQPQARWPGSNTEGTKTGLHPRDERGSLSIGRLRSESTRRIEISDNDSIKGKWIVKHASTEQAKPSKQKNH